MSSNTLTQLVTYDDYRHLPDDGKQYQIIEGELYMTPAPSTEHQRIARNLFVILYNHATEHDLGEVFFAPVDIIFTMTDVVQPDILFIAEQRRQIITRRNVVAAPDLAVEVLSESTKNLDREKKKDLYLRHKVKEYWIVDSEACAVEQFILQKDTYNRSLHSNNDTFTSIVVDELTVTVDDIFA